MNRPDNIREVSRAGIDMAGFVFTRTDPRYVKSELSHAGIIPDRADSAVRAGTEHIGVPTAGVFADEMPQTVITQIYNYRLDYVILCGGESRIYIDNLRCTLVPDIVPEVKIIKAFALKDVSEINLSGEFEGGVEMFLFKAEGGPSGRGEGIAWSEVAEAYAGDTPFLLAGNIQPDDAGHISEITHPLFAGICIYSEFETFPGVKDAGRIAEFIKRIR